MRAAPYPRSDSSDTRWRSVRRAQSPAALRLLLVEDNPGDARLVREHLRAAGRIRFDLVHVLNLRDARKRLARTGFDAVLLDLGLPDAFGLEALSSVRAAAPGLPIIVLTALEDEDKAAEALKRGAQDYLVKGKGDGDLLLRSVRYAIERQQTDRDTAFLAYHDPLTELPNRGSLRERLEEALQAARRNGCRLATMFIDLDHFKEINDSLGHAIGDALLVAVAQRLRSCTRSTDIIGRLGGDEFAVIVPGLDRTDREVSSLANKVGRSLGGRFLLEGRELAISASIGVSVYPNDAADAETLLRNADIAMYRAKKAGGGSVRLYSAKPDAEGELQHELRGSLRRARANGQLVLHYQPIFAVQTGRVAGFEALIRWKHPKLGLLLPSRFIPLAERCGLIGSIGAWVAQEACEHSKTWRSAGFENLRVSLNVSALQVGDPRLIDSMTDALAAADLRPELLEIELTETAIVRNLAAARETLEKLKAIGVRLCIDDFGTGDSALSHLLELPIDAIKIDRTFIERSLSEPMSKAILEGLITMTRAGRMEVVAKGVETRDQLDLLLGLGCGLAQGELLGLPMPGTVLRTWLRAREGVVEP